MGLARRITLLIVICFIGYLLIQCYAAVYRFPMVSADDGGNSRIDAEVA